MSAESIPVVSQEPVPPFPSPAAKPVRLWPAVALLALFWGGRLVVEQLDKFYFIGFLYSLASSGLLVLLFFAWWWTNRGIRLADRLYGFLVIVGGGLVVEPLCHPSIGWF